VGSETGGDGAFYRRGMQTFDVEAMTDHLQQAHFLLRQVAVGGGNLAGQGIGRFAQMFGQGVADQADDGFKPVLAFEQVGAGTRRIGQGGYVVIVENGRDCRPLSYSSNIGKGQRRCKGGRRLYGCPQGVSGAEKGADFIQGRRQFEAADGNAFG